MTSAFEGIRGIVPTAKTSKATEPFFSKPGRVLARVTSAKVLTSRKPKTKGQQFILVKFQCVQARDGDYQVGDANTFYSPLVGAYELRDIQALGAAAYGVEPALVTPEIMDLLFDAKDPALVGRVLEVVILENSAGNVDAKGVPYVKVFFNSAPEVAPTATEPAPNMEPDF